MRVNEKILDLARWAPSGDNTQPWRFELLDERRFIVHGFDTRDWCLYDIDGRPSQIALGALLENVAIAASTHSMRASITRRIDAPDAQPTFDVRLDEAPDIETDSLAPYIAVRSVQRRALATRPLSMAIKRTADGGIAAIVGTGTLSDVTSKSKPIVIAEAMPMVVTATDGGQPAASDALSFTLYKPTGGLWMATGWDGIRAVETPLQQGAVGVHPGN